MACKSKHKKQKLANGGLVDTSMLSPEQLAYYNTLDEMGQQAFAIEFQKSMQNQNVGTSSNQTTTADAANLVSSIGSTSSSGASISSVGGIIGAATGIAEAAGGEEDKYGAHESDVQTYLARSADIGGNISAGIEQIGEGDVLTGLGNILQLGGAMNVTEDREVEEAKRKEREALMLATGQIRTQQASFKNGGSVPEDKKKKEKDVGTLNLPQEIQTELYGDDEGPKPLFTSDEIITGMLKEGYTPFPEDRKDNIQESYQMSDSDRAVYDAFETKDIQNYMINQLGLDLDDFGVDNIYGKETGEVLSRYITERSNIDKIEPIQPTTQKTKPELQIQNQKSIDKILFYGPNKQIYQADPNTFDLEGAEKNFTRSADRETLQYLTEVGGLDYESSKELLKTEEGRQELVEKFNRSQGYSENIIQAYARQGSFPIYKSGKLKGVERIYDDEGNLVIKDVESLNYAEGGTVQGKGTGKSDSIDTELTPGDFVIPTDSPVSNNALKSMMEILELDHTTTKQNLDKVADKKSVTRDVSISNGEKIIPKDKVMMADQLLKQMGYRNGLQDAAPNSEYDFLTYQNII